MVNIKSLMMGVTFKAFCSHDNVERRLLGRSFQGNFTGMLYISKFLNKKENLVSVAKQLGEIVRNLHEISLEGTKSFPRDFLAFLKSRRTRIVSIHKVRNFLRIFTDFQKWGSISFDLIDQIDSYLPKEHELDKLITREVLIHADLTDDNILGHFADDEDPQVGWEIIL